MPKHEEPTTQDSGHVMVRMAYQSPQDSHWETLEISVPPTASDEYINDAFVVYGKVRKIMAKTIVELLTADDNPRIDQAVQPDRAPYPQQGRTAQANGGNSTNRTPAVVYVEGDPFRTVLNFGMYKGHTLAEIEDKDEGYIEWLYENGRDEKLKAQCNVIITMRGSDDYHKAMGHGPVMIDDVHEEVADDENDLFDSDLHPAN
jgi:hypothetical protein